MGRSGWCDEGHGGWCDEGHVTRDVVAGATGGMRATIDVSTYEEKNT